jgi:lipoate-protein ligase A
MGIGSQPDRELDLAACIRDRLPLYKRRGGGCSVILDLGNVVVSAVFRVKGIADTHRYFKVATEWMISALQQLGFDRVVQGGTSDLVLNDRKIGGSCVYRSKDFLYYSASLLVAPSIELCERYLKHPPREPAYRRGRLHRDFMGRLSDEGSEYRLEAFSARLRQCLLAEDLEQRLRISQTSVPPQRISA